MEGVPCRCKRTLAAQCERRAGPFGPAGDSRASVQGSTEIMVVVKTPRVEGSVEHVLRELAPQVLGATMRKYGDFAAAEDAVQEALIAAASQWPGQGVPDNPRGWLIQVASRRMTDHIRSESARRRREADAAQQIDEAIPAIEHDTRSEERRVG